MRRLACFVLLAMMGTMGTVLAQTGVDNLPLIRLSDFSVDVGEDLVLSASDLEPDTEYELSLTSPDGEESVETLEADSEGKLDYSVQFDEAGRWQLGLNKLNFSVPIQVQEVLDPANSPSTQDSSEATTPVEAPNNSDEEAEAALQEETNEAFAPLTEESDSEIPGETEEAAEEPSSGVDETTDETTGEPAETPVLTPTEESATADTQEDGATGETPPTQSQDPEPAVPDETLRRGPFVSLALALGRSGWYGVAALLVAIVALHAVLIAKYWLAQTVNLERRRILGRSVAVWSRALAMRYYSLTEKLVILLLFVTVTVMAVLAAWSTPGVHPESWNEAVVRVFQNPWNGLLALRPGGTSEILWTLMVVLFLLAVLITVVWLFVPRLRWVGNTPRPVMYHLLAALVPGSGLADEMWGLLLIIPWALFGLDALIDLMGWGFGLGLSLFWDAVIVFIIYLINLVAVVVEYLSYRRRMDTLKRDNPELAQEFGLLSSIR